MTELPQSFYYIVGFLIITNIGMIGSVLLFAGRSLWWLSKLDSRVNDAKASAIRAHKRIDVLASVDD